MAGSKDRELLEGDGRVWLRNALSDQDLIDFGSVLSADNKPGQRLPIGGGKSGLMRILGPETGFSRSIQQVLPDARPVCMISFNKTRENNWAVSARTTRRNRRRIFRLRSVEPVGVMF